MFEADNGTIEIPVDPQRIAAQVTPSGRSTNLGIEPVGVTALPFFSDTRPDVVVYRDETRGIQGRHGGGADVDFKGAALKPGSHRDHGPPGGL
ncbi:MAG: hypothetical protein R2722_07125 [Tessaracoccus sp.]